MIKKIYQINEQALMCDFGENISKKINSNVISFFNHINNKRFIDKELGINNCVPSYNKLLIQYDLNKTSYNQIINLINSISFDQLSEINTENLIELPICYEEEFALDLKDIAAKSNLNVNEVINLHLSTESNAFGLSINDLQRKLENDFAFPAESVLVFV